MPPFGPISQKRLIQCLRRAGFSALYGKGAHKFMNKGDIDVKVPNPHKQEDIGIDLLKKILYQAGISREEWEKL